MYDSENLVNPGKFEMVIGPVKSGKTKEINQRLKQAEEIYSMVFVPLVGNNVEQRIEINMHKYDAANETKGINEKDPGMILHDVNAKTKIVVIDNLHFFYKNLEEVIKELLSKNINVIGAGLDYDFRGRPFGNMNGFIAMVDCMERLKGKCEYKGCNAKSTRTQRFFKGKLAPYESPIRIRDTEYIVHEGRCIEHFKVPKKERK